MLNPRVLLRYLLAVITLGLVSCEKPPPVPSSEADAVSLAPGVTLELARYRASVIRELNYRLELSLPRDEAEDIAGAVVVTFELAQADKSLQLDFREEPERLLSSRINGTDAPIEVVDEHLLIPAELLKRGRNTLEFRFLAGSSSLNRNPDFLYTLFVPDRARTAFPVFDQPDLKATWELTLEMPADWTALSAAPVAREESGPERRTVQFERSDLISTYLFSFVAGAFDRITRTIDGRTMTMLHRETDQEKVARNVDEIFRLHAAALTWLESYTGISHPYQKLDFALIPAHPYGGMEHVGAIQYRADRLWLDEGASDTQLLNRASLISHEVAHMWFGNLVTMRWFNDVWTKEVFANFMAAKMVNPSFPAIDHELRFLVDHHPSAYSIDRTGGANPIRQPLANLNQAGQLYGPIIYEKAPIMMRQLELLLGEESFRDGIREYLTVSSHANSSWPELIDILDRRSDADLATWSETWVNTAGRPTFALEETDDGIVVAQKDPAGADRLWPQRFLVSVGNASESESFAVLASAATTPLAGELETRSDALLFNADGYGYGLFPADTEMLAQWQRLAPLPLASLLINSFEQMLEGGMPTPDSYLPILLDIATGADNQLLINLALGQLKHVFWSLRTDDARQTLAAELEARIWEAMDGATEDSLRKIYFNAYANLALTPEGLKRVQAVWSGALRIDDLPLAERDFIRLTQELAIKDPAHADNYLDTQRARTENPDQQRRLAFLAPTLAADQAVRDAFFYALADEQNRTTESWVLTALANLHHPLRTGISEAYLRPSLELLEEIQATGDIFFPAGWLNRTLRYHHSATAVATIEGFLNERPTYNPQLRMKILQAADPVFRSQRLRR